MHPKIFHRWDLSEKEAISLQNEFSAKVTTEDVSSFGPRKVAGVDVAYDKDTDQLFAAVVVFDLQNLELIEISTATDVARFPYIPGLFSFREIPSLTLALSQLRTIPDAIVCDGQGIAHPRRFGLACHLGVLFDIPTIGCAKTRLIGSFATTPILRGERCPLVDNSETIGSVLCTQNKTKPLFISVGHKIALPTACSLILRLSPKYRQPEVVRLADQIANTLRKR